MSNKYPVIDPQEVADYIAQFGPETKVYLGADSEKMKVNGVWYADYMLVCVVHVHDHAGIGKGCHIFGEVVRERVYDQDKAKPTMRLMNEVYKVAELYERLKPIFGSRDVQIHLDLNPNKKYVSNHVVSQALGYIKGVTQIDAQIKPEAFSASYAADQLKNILSNRSHQAKVKQNA